MTVRGAPAWALLAIALLGAGEAVAQEPPSSGLSDADKARAKEMFENGQILYEEGRYEQAIAAWEESYRLSSYPDLLYNISSAYEKLGDYTKALDALNRYRVYAKADERDTLDRRIRALEERQASKAQEEADRVVTPPPDPVVTDPVTTSTATVEPPKRGVRVLPIALLGTGVVGLGTGGVFALQAGGARGDIVDQCVLRDTGGYLCPEGAQASVDAYGRSSTIGVVGLAAGGVLAGAGVVVAVVGGGGSSDISVSVAPRIGGDGAALRLSGRF